MITPQVHRPKSKEKRAKREGKLQPIRNMLPKVSEIYDMKMFFCCLKTFYFLTVQGHLSLGNHSGKDTKDEEEDKEEETSPAEG